jgi:predicted TIM-barrel fold metal-dependent hydrolase
MSLYRIAKEYADVKMVMAHSGMLVFSGNAARVLEACPNVYGDSAWTPGFPVRDRIRACGLTEQEQRQVFSDTAVAVFNLKTRRTA